MPPRASYQTKDLTRIFTYLRNIFGTQPNSQTIDPQEITIDDNRNSNFANLQTSPSQTATFISTVETPKPLTDTTSAYELNHTFKQDNFIQRIGIDIKAPKILIQNEQAESIQKGLESKLDFGDKISSKQQREIVQGINSLIQNKSTPLLVKDVLTTLANSKSFDKISFVATEPPLFALTLANSADVFSKSGKTVEIHDVDSKKSTKEAIKSVVRASTYVYQKEMLDNGKTAEIYDNLSLGNAFLRDVLEHSDHEKVRKIYSNVLAACFVNSETSDEEQTKAVKALHANVLAEMAFEPKETKKNFPNALEKIESIHKQYNQKKAVEQRTFKFTSMNR